MTASELINIFLRLEMAAKDETSEIAFDSGKDGASPFSITGVHLDEDGDICLESDESTDRIMSPREIADAVGSFDGNRTIYFVSIDRNGESVLYNIKDGGTKDRDDRNLRLIPVSELLEALAGAAAEAVLHFESGTINFTINSIYIDEQECICLESNEIEELDDYPAAMIAEEISGKDCKVYFYDDEAGEYYGIYTDERRTDDKGDIWIKVR